MEKKAVTIFSASTARKLLKDGYIISDIKADRTDPDGKRTVFVFRNENNIMDKKILFINTGGTPLFFDDLEEMKRWIFLY